jgi:hypothetical protein
MITVWWEKEEDRFFLWDGSLRAEHVVREDEKALWR